MHCLGLDQEFQLAKIPVQTLGGTPDGDMIVYGYEDVMNYEAITKWDDFSSRNNAV